MKARRIGLAPQSVSDEITFYALDEVASPSEANYWLRANVSNGNLSRRWNGKNYEFRWTP